MATLDNGTKWTGSLTLTKKSGTKITLETDDSYVDKDVELTLNVQSGAGAANTASADANVESDETSRNISSAIGAKSDTAPASGYYLRVGASGSGSSKVTTEGWLDTGNLPTASTTSTKYFPVTGATVTQNAPTINTSTGLVTATTSVTEGYTPADSKSNTLQLTTKSATTYNASTSAQSISAGTYLTGKQTIRAITTENIDAGNIKDGVVVKVGDSGSATRIKNVTGTFTDASTVSAGQTAATASKILSGYSAWVDGAEVQGTITQKSGSDITVDGKTVSVPAGVYASDVTASVAVGTITSGSATISSISHSYNSTSGKFNVSGSANVSAPTVGTAGYVSSTEGTKNVNNNGATVSATVNKIAGSTTLAGITAPVTPTISKQSVPSGVVDASNGDATTTVPSSGVYVAVKSAENKGTITATPSISTAGYGTSDYHGISAHTTTVGANASSVTYVPIATTSASVSGKTVSYGSGWITEGSNSVADGSVTQNTPTINASTGVVTATSTVTEGYVSAGEKSNTLALSTLSATTYNTSSSNQEIATGKYLTGKQTIRAVTTENITADNIKYNVVAKVGDSASAGRIKNVTGTFTATPSGKSALTAESLRSGYAGFINGAQVNGSMADTTVTEGTSTSEAGATWSQTAGYTSARVIPTVVYANEATSGHTYVDIDERAPALIAGDYLYINKGYTDDVKISLAKLVPDGSDVKGHGDYILSGHSAYDNDGTLVAGTIPSLSATTYNTSTSNQTIASGKYISGTQTIRAVTTSGIDAGNIKYNQTIKVGDAGSATRIKNVTGTFTKASTVSSGQTAASAGQILSGYSAWVDGAEVKGSIASKTSSNLSVDGKTITAPAGYYASDASASVALGTVTSGSATISSASYAYNSTNGNFDVTGSETIGAPTVGTAGYISSSEGTRNTNTATLATTVDKIVGSTSITGTSTKTPVISKQAISITGVTDAAGGSETTTAPSSGVYVAVQSAKSTGTLTATPTVTTAGYGDATNHGIAKGTKTVGANASALTYVPITTATPAFDGGALSGSSTATGTNVTLSTTDNGMKIQTAYTASRGAVLYNGAVNGWVSKADDAEALASDSLASTNGTAYYVTAVTMPKDKGFTVTTTADTALDTTSDLDVTNNAYRRVDITNNANGTVLVANSGNTTVSSGSTTAGNLTVTAYNSSGTSEANKSIVSAGKWVSTTVSDGGTYYGRVTVATGSITSGTASITSVSTAYNSTNDNFDVTGSADVSAPTVGTAGFVSSSKGTKNAKSNGATVSTTLAKIVGSTSITGTTTKAPSIAKQAISISGVTDAASGSATTTAPSSGVYVAVKSAANTGTLTATPSVTTEGYGTASNHGISAQTVTVGASASSVTYVPITTATPAFDGGTLSGGSTATGTNVTLSTTDNGMKVQTAYTASSTDVLYNGAVNGWVSKADNTVALAGQSKASTNGTAYYVTGVTMPKDKGFTVTTTADTALDTSSDLDVTNNAYRRVDISNAANGTVLVSNTGNVEVTSASTSAGKVTVKAKVASGDSSTTNQDVVVNGLWKNNAVSASGTYYGRTVVGGGSATTPATTITSTPSISVNASGLITASNSKTQSVTPTVSAGYVSSGTAGTITVSGSNTSQLTTKAATTYTPSTSNQTIASGTYLTGVQTIKGDSNLTAANIKKGTSIFGITGTFTTTPSGKTALTAAALRSGYAGFINGSQVNGSMADSVITEGTSTSAIGGIWSQTAGYTSAHTISAVTYANEGTSGHTYVDIDERAPVLVAGDYLYINKGWTDDVKISLAKLVPDGSDVKGHGEYILSGHSAYDNDGTLVAGTIPTIASTDLAVSGKTVTVPVGYYTGASGATAVTKSVADGAYSASVSAHSVSTTPVVTGAVSGTVTNIGTTTQPSSGTDGTDYWTITPSGSVTTTGVSSAKGKATIGTAGYLATGNKTSSASTVNITPTVSNGSARYILKGAITNNTSGGTSTATVNRGSQIKIGSGYYPSDLYYTAQSNSGTLTLTTSHSANTNVSCDGYANVKTTGITMPKDVGYTVVTTADTALDTSSDLDVTNNAYRRVDITNKANGTVLVANSGNTTVSSGSATAGNLTVSAYNSSGTAENNKSIVSAGKWVATSVSASGTYYGRVTVAGGAYSASVSAHSVSTTPVVTGSISGTVTNIGTTTTPSGTDGTNYWTITPSGSVTTTGVSTSKGKATIGTAGYLATGNTESSAHTVSITPTVTNGSARYIVKGTVTNSTTLPSGSSSSGTCSRGKYVKIGAGYYPNDLYYLAQNNSGTLTISETSNAGTNISCNGKSNVNITGINIPAGKSFTVKVPNGDSTMLFIFNVDSSGNVTITEN